jgi:hypothetical protein
MFMRSQSLTCLIISLAKRKKKIIINLKNNRAICNVPEIQAFCPVVGGKHFDDQHFLAAPFDYFFLMLHGLLYPQEN